MKFQPPSQMLSVKTAALQAAGYSKKGAAAVVGGKLPGQAVDKLKFVNSLTKRGSVKHGSQEFGYSRHGDSLNLTGRSGDAGGKAAITRQGELRAGGSMGGYDVGFGFKDQALTLRGSVEKSTLSGHGEATIKRNRLSSARLLLESR